jgi:hypothetical protein
VVINTAGVQRGSIAAGAWEIQNCAILRFDDTVTSPSINQADDTNNGITGDTFTIRAQDCSGTTTTGGDLHLRPGTGTLINGALEIQDGYGNAKALVDDEGFKTEAAVFNNSRVTASGSTYDVDDDDYIIHCTYTPTGTVTVTLPPPDSVRHLVVKDAGGNASGNTITIQQNGSEDVDGGTSVTITTDYGSIRLYSDGTDWFTW